MKTFVDGKLIERKSTILNPCTLSLDEDHVTYVNIDVDSLTFGEYCIGGNSDSDEEITYESFSPIESPLPISDPLPKPIPIPNPFANIPNPIARPKAKLSGLKRNRDFLKRTNALVCEEMLEDSPIPAKPAKLKTPDLDFLSPSPPRKRIPFRYNRVTNKVIGNK